MSSQIYSLIPKIMEAVGAIEKTKRVQAGQGGNYAFRGVDDVMNAFHPAFIKFGVFCVPETLEYDTKEHTNSNGKTVENVFLRVAFTFFAPDGSCIRAVTVGEGMDFSDKAANKAMSAAFKYAMFQVFCIPTQEIVDPDAEIIERGARKNGSQNQPPNGNGNGNGAKKYSREELMKLIGERIQELNTKGERTEFPKPLAEMTEDELLNFGKELRSRLDKHLPPY